LTYTHLLGRKGSPHYAGIPAEVRHALSIGAIPTVNLTEFLAIDLPLLTRSVAQHIGIAPTHERLHDTLAMLDAFKPLKRHDHIARALYDITATLPQPQPDRIANALAQHPSDVARCWAATWVKFSGLNLQDKLQAIRRFAADPHFGVREIAWMAVRDAVIAQLDEAVTLLTPWVHDADDNIRRFASELTRPKGVWCPQIDALKRDPQRALALLHPLKADPSRYVQNSVANWLNDASKSQPAWVCGVCDAWLQESDSPHTAYIVRGALRSLRDGMAS
jgi:3-methyladenine DNA glycosylase AlkC